MAHPSQVQNFAGTGEGAGAQSSGTRSVSPTPLRTPYEEAIMAICRDILGRSDIGVSDDLFDLGAHSLHAIGVVARISKTLGVDIPVRDFFEGPTVAALASVAAARSSAVRRAVGPRPADADPVLSFDQQRLWLENQLKPAAAYNVHGRHRLLGQLNVATLDASIRAILTRHEALRTRFPTVAGRPVQVVDEPDEDWRISVEDLTGLEASERAATAERLADDHGTTPFDLADGPLFRCLLIKMSDTEHILSVTMHHIVCDAWSIGLFARELSALYQADADVDRAGLPALPIQYRDYAVWQRAFLVGDAVEPQVSYWRRHLAGAPPALALPTAQRYSSARGATGSRTRFELSHDETAALHELCRKYGVTSFMVLLASLATVLGRWSGQSDVVIGVPVASRTDGETDKLIGFFVNTLPFRVDMSGNPTFADLLSRVRQIALDGYAHADAPFDVLVKELQATRDPARTPLFQVVLNVIDGLELGQIDGISIEPIDTPATPSKFDLTFSVQESRGVLQFEVNFNGNRYQAAMIGFLIAHVGIMVRSAIKDPTRGILDYPFQSGQDAADVRSSPGGYPASAPHLAVERYARHADRVAVADRDGEWSYQWLSQAADRVARYLAERYSPDGDHLGIMRRPTAAFAAVILGCMRAGVTFSVLDEAGSGQVRYLGISAILDAIKGSEAADGTIDLSALFADQADPSPAGHEDATGPVGADDGDWAAGRFGLSSDDRFTVLSSSSAHLLSALSTAFCAGGTLVIPEHSVADENGALISSLQTSSVSVIYVTPPILRAIAARQPRLPALKCVFIDNSGDLIANDIEALRQLAPGCQAAGLYRVGRDGRPLAVYEVPDDWQLQTAPLRVPLGTELEGAPVQLLHPSGRPAATGEVAEISFGSYQTGDLGRRWSDGTLEFVRQAAAGTEPDLVETIAALRDIPEVRDAVVTENVGVDGSTVLLGYVTGPDPSAGTAGIRQRLALRLPDNLIPQHLAVLDELPLTRRGDYDLSVLPEPETEDGATESYVAPRTPMERQLTDILEELLAVDRVSIYDTFFELGGFSLLATRLTSRIREIFDVEPSLRDVFESTTVDQLAQLVVRLQGEVSGTADLEALLDEIGA
jgi:non-ribosomal peptide synthetase component F/acyl carrier protein